MATVVTVLGGRVIPFFTTRALDLPTISPINLVEKSLSVLMLASFISFLLTAVYDIKALAGGLFVLTGIVHLIRLVTWRSLKTIKTPLLWSLHLSYFNLALGFIAMGLSYTFNLMNFSDAIHIITLGTIGAMILAMRSRVSLGHTGRVLQINRWIACAFILLFLATIARTALPIFGWVMNLRCLCGH